MIKRCTHVALTLAILALPCLAEEISLEYDWLSPWYNPFLTHSYRWEYSWVYPVDRLPYSPYYRYSPWTYYPVYGAYRYPAYSYLVKTTFDPADFGIDPWWDVNVYGLRGMTFYYTTPPTFFYSRGGYTMR
ncbi:MAG: hypothetical protein N3G75_07360 [Methanothrix sp.]|nr:hypothetical protein [Methanothrix sp.]